MVMIMRTLFVAIGGFVCIGILIAIYISAYYGSEEQITLTISSKERITTGSGESISSKYLVYASDEVFENTDSFLYGKFNSADIQNMLKNDSTYICTVAGWRVPFLSMFRNIVDVEYTNIGESTNDK